MSAAEKLRQAIPAEDWLYSTYVFRHSDEAAARALNTEIFERFPFGSQDAPSCLTAVSVGDAMSVSDAMRMALECRSLDSYEQRELALEMAERGTWESCLALAAEWELRVELGDFVEARGEQVTA